MERTIVIAGGGTGGHVFPGIAIADEIRAREPETEIVFVGTERGLEARVVPERGYRLELVRVLPLNRVGVWRMAMSSAILAREMAAASALVLRLRPSIVLCLGGYAGGPVSLVAGLARVPLVLFEPNAVVGFTNRVLARIAKRAYVAWPEMESNFPRGVGAALGVPVRDAFRRVREDKPRAHTAPRVLVVGGSQGARYLNETLPLAFAHARELGVTCPIVHQCGKGEVEQTRERYAAVGLSADVRPFINDMASEIENADLVVARAGAVSIAEICAEGRASILVPLPTAADDHQSKNADILVRRGAAYLAEQKSTTPESLGATLASLLTNAPERARMEKEARALGRPEATKRIVDDMLTLAR